MKTGNLQAMMSIPTALATGILCFGLLLTAGACQQSRAIAPSGPAAGDQSVQSAEARSSRTIPVAATEYEFAAPFRVQAGGEYIAVEPPGYACPTMADVDGDGVDDLVVGQFRQGNMRYFRNVAAKGQTPRLEAGQWLMTDNARAVVPGVW